MTIVEDPGEISGFRQPAWDYEQSVDKALCHLDQTGRDPSFEGDQISPCNAHTFPVAKIISDVMWPVSVTGHTVLVALSSLLQCDMIKFRGDETFSNPFFPYGYTLKIKFC